ncbi:Calx-beta domain-containing protein [uncultured Ruminococcus sp.]|uniref:Calx-beta domain-containing protein n=1 Tax=uncultured Ruminococcus sp. TaxID=165186 RepID=UPI0025EECE92|nr:Calx-beta domain-containing protein [uncultured Ruminococcus sp.]
MTVRKGAKKIAKKILALVLSLSILLCGVPSLSVAAKETEKSYTRLYNYDELAQRYLSENEEAQSEYPNGAFMFPLSSSQLKQNELYAVEVFREGGTKGEASITVKSVDMTAQYGVDYELFLDNKNISSPVEGEANPYYDMEEYSFIATHTQSEVVYASNNEENTQKVRKDASEYNDYLLNEVMPTSSEFTLNFADGENSKTIFIQTLQKDEVTANLEFTLNLCNPEGGSIGVQTSCAFTILEEREIPPTYLELLEGSVNPDSEEAYITVKRSGNMGTTGTFTIRTESASAKAGQAYQAVQMPLEFTPGMSEIKVPVTMLDKAESGTYFNACLEDVTVADSKNQKKKMNITDKVRAELSHETTFTASQQYLTTSSMVNTNTGSRGVQIIDASQFDVATVTDRGTGSQSHGYNKDGSDMKLEYNNHWSSSNNCISARSREKINFTGVDSITIAIDNFGGSTASDDQLFYVSDDDKFQSNTSNYDWVHNLGGIGGCWNMTNIGDSFIQRTANLDRSKVKGEHYLYLALHKGAVVGYAGYKVYNRGTEDISHNLRLNMTKYNLTVIEPDTTKIYVDGTLADVQVAKNVLLVDPASMHGNDRNTGASFDIYRDETSAISASVDSQFNGLAKLDGVYFCESGKTSNHSELYKLESDSFTLTADILEKYSSYIKDNKIVIQPVYSVSDSSLRVESFDNTKTTGQKFVADNDNCKGEFYYLNEHIGTLSWTQPRTDTKNYLVADTLKFNFEYADGISSHLWNMKLDTRAASTESLLSTADIITKNTGTLSVDIQLSNLYFSVTPNFCLADTTTVLNVTNPDNGDFIGKGGKYATKNSDGSVTLKGYSAQDGATDTIFSDMSVNEIITFHAQPNSGYRAKWSYTDSASHRTKTYYGNSFFFAIQNPYDINDNHITLTFEKTGDDYQTFSFYGQTLLQEGSIINPPTSQTDTYNLVSGAQITMDSYSALSDENGEFHLETNPGNESSEIVKISASKDEIHRALVFYNHRYFICDINMAEYLSSGDVSSITAKLKMQYKTNGVTPTKINAVSSDGTVYGDTITLITANAVQFDVTLDTKGQSADKPVNLVRWSVENEDGIKSKYDVALEKGQTVSHWANTLSEIIKQGDKLYVELLWKGYDDKANEIFSSYGKFDTGYSFVATSVTDTITYAPDVGAPATMSQPIPVLGPVSPTVSIKGFTPIINTGTAGKDKDGHEINTITIGVSFGKLKDAAAKDSKWNSAGPLDKAKKLGDILSNYDAANNSAAGLPKNAIGKSLANSLNMKTAVKLSFSITLCYQGNYYVDDKGEWQFVGNLFIAGAGGSIRVSMPFVLCYIPCFAYFTASINVNIYMGIFANNDGEPGSSVALTLDQLSDANASTFQGVYELKIGLGAGVGIGFDGLLSASGGVDFKFDIQFNDYLRGVGTVGMSGSITLELLFLKATWSDNLFKTEMFNTLGDTNDIMNLRKLQAQVETDLLKNTTIGDMVVSTAEASKSRLAPRGLTEEKVVEATDTLVNPEIISIGNGRYLVVSASTDTSSFKDNILHFYIYDEPSNSVVDSGSVLKRAIEDAYGNETAEKLTQLTEDYHKIDHDAVMADCGDDILIAWNKCMIAPLNDTSKMLNSVGIATIYYNKESGKFHDYKVISDKDKKYLYMTPQLVYNSSSDTVQLFYQAMNIEKITLDTTLEELQSYPTVLLTSYCSADGGDWSDGEPVSINGKYLKYFDAAPYGDKILLSYVASDTYGFTLDSIDDFEVESDFDVSPFEANNSLYIQSFEISDGKLTASNPMRITKDGYVAANPEFINISTQGVENTLLFYRCNGAYAYQNITNILTNGLYTDLDGYSQISEAYVEPQFISETEDYTTNDDFSVFTNGSGDIYALWTTTESNQQQIWARQFVFNRFDKVTEVGKLDSNGIIIYDENSNPVMEKLDNPIYLLNGYWGGKTYLTEGGVYGSDSFGMYKDDFSAAVLENGDLLTAFNAFDREITEDGCKYVNNMLVISEYNTDSEYHMPEEIDAIEFSNEYPTGGETVNVTCHAENLGVNSGRDVTVTLYVNGKAYDSITESVWLSAQAKAFDFYYTLPKGQRADDVSMYFTVTEDGEEKLVSDSFAFKYGVDLEITALTLSEINLITEDNDNAKFFVRATVQNKGNENYTGGDYVRLVDYDVEEMCKAIEDGYEAENPIYTSFGRELINSIEIGNTTEVCFISEDIPSQVFEKTGTDTAYLECIISDKNEPDWKTRNSEEKFSAISEFYSGLTSKPVPKTAQSLSISDITVQVNKQQKLSKSVQPVSSLINSQITYSSSDESVATVDDFGVVTGHKEGKAVITAKIDGISDAAEVTVSNTPVPTQPSETEPTGDIKSTENTDNTQPSVSKGNGAHTDGDAGVMQTGGITMTIIILIMLASAAVVFFLRKRRNGN